jgi:dienelactone hydrolase
VLAVLALCPAPGRADEPVTTPAPPAALRAADARGLGRAHGQRFREPIRSLLAALETALTTPAPVDGSDPMAAVLTAARTAAQGMPEALREEIEGIAEGAGQPVDAVLLLNLWPNLATLPDGTRLALAPPAGANFVAGGLATTTGELLHGTTLDTPFAAALRPWIQTIVVEPPTGRPFVTVGWPGMVGTLCAMNTAGLTISAESLPAAEVPTGSGLPLCLLLRDVIQHATSLDDAVERLTSAPGGAGARITVSDGERLEMRVVERHGGKAHVRIADAGLLLGAEDDAGPECYLGACDPDIPAPDAASRTRHAAAGTRLLEARPHLRASDAAMALGAAGDEATLYTCLLWPATRDIALVAGPVAAAGVELLARRGGWMEAVSPEGRGPFGMPPRVAATGLPSVVRRPPFELPGARRHFLSIPSPRPSGFAFNDTIPVELWLPEDGPARGVLLQLPAWKERTLVGHRALALALVRQGIAVAIVPLPYQNGREPPGRRAGEWTLSSDLARTRQALVQGLADAVAVSRVLERDFDLPPARQAIGGVSLGAHVAATALGMYPGRFAAGACVLAGGRIHEGFTQPNSVTGRLQRELVARGVLPGEGEALLAPLEPLDVADSQRGEALLLIAADADDAVTPERARALAEAWGTPHLLWLEGGHYAPARPDQALKVLEAIPEHLLRVFPPR